MRLFERRKAENDREDREATQQEKQANMSVDLVALYVELYAQCEQSADGIYRADFTRFYQDTGFTTVNVLTPLLKIGAIGVSTPDNGGVYHIWMVGKRT